MKPIGIMLWLGMGAVLIGGADAERVYTVCELLANPLHYAGKHVKVRGAVEGGMEGAWLKSSECPERFYVGENSLPKAISLSYQSEYEVTPNRNIVHIQRVEGQIREMRRRTKSNILILTYIGLFETRVDWKVLTLGKGEKQLWGFGHLNAFPAQLVVVDISDPLIIERK